MFSQRRDANLQRIALVAYSRENTAAVFAARSTTTQWCNAYFDPSPLARRTRLALAPDVV